MNSKKRVFISFDFDNDQFLRDSMVGQSRLESSPFEIEDWSVKEPWSQSVWKEKCREKMSRVDMVFVMVGENTSSCSGVLEEIRIAKELGIPVYAIEGYKNKYCQCPKDVDGYYVWTWDNINNLLLGYR